MIADLRSRVRQGRKVSTQGGDTGKWSGWGLEIEIDTVYVESHTWGGETERVYASCVCMT